METLLCDAIDALASHLPLGVGRLARVSTAVRLAVDRADVLSRVLLQK